MKRTTLVIILLAIWVVSCLVFTACGEPEHTCSFGEWTVIEKATCTEAGQKVRVCECGESQTEIIPAGHSYTPVVKAPTCTEQGFTTHTCQCGDSYVDTYVDALGHDEIEHVAQVPTCSEVGWDAYVTCSRCDYSTYSGIITIDHNFQQSDTCENCGQNIADVAVDCFDMSATEDDNIKCYVIPRQDNKCDAYIKGTGAMKDYYYYNGSEYNLPFIQKAYTIAAAYISNGVTTIGNWTFYYCRSLTSISMPDNVTTIGHAAFAFCDSLISVTIGDSVTTIGDAVFAYCDSLTSITIPDSVTTIGSYAFVKCDSLTSITIPDSVTTIGSYAFYDCDSLTSITIPDSVTTIGSQAFRYCDSFTDVYYTGTEEQWNNITIDDYNSDLNNATIHFNYTGEEN